MLSKGKPIEPTGSPYSNVTMVGNWWEDRFIPQDHKLTSTDRVLATDLSGGVPPSTSTKQASDNHMLTSHVTKVPPKPSMFPEPHLQQMIQGYGVPTSLTYTLGRAHLQGDNDGPQQDYTTTNKHFYKDLPQQAVETHPEHYPETETVHRKRGTLTGTLCTQRLTDPQGDPHGGKGARGEISRNPREGGNPYGVNVFADEYAKWGTKLQGMPLQETVDRKMTQYY